MLKRKTKDINKFVKMKEKWVLLCLFIVFFE